MRRAVCPARKSAIAVKVGGKVEGALGDLTGDSKMKADGAVDKVAGGAQNTYGKAADTVRDMADKVGAGDFGSQVLDQIEEAGDMLAEQVDARPITAILVAAGVGFLIALATKPAPQVIYRRR